MKEAPTKGSTSIRKRTPTALQMGRRLDAHPAPSSPAETNGQRPQFGEPPKRRNSTRRIGKAPEPLGIVPAVTAVAQEGIESPNRRRLGTYTAHFSHPFHVPERRLVGYSLYPHQVDTDPELTVRPRGPNDAGQLILIPSFRATLLPEDQEHMSSPPSFWYAKSGGETVKYNPKTQELYLEGGGKLPR